jgi:hypothetical protein
MDPKTQQLLVQDEHWVRAAAPNESRALLIIKRLLEEVSITVLIQRDKDCDAPEFRSAGPRDVLVPSLLAAEARELLDEPSGLSSWA